LRKLQISPGPQNAPPSRRPRQHAQSADPRQRRRHAVASRVLVPRARHVIEKTRHDGAHRGLGVVEIFSGIAIILVSQSATFARIEPFWSWKTPICWTGFILFADGIVWRARRDSWLRSAPREF